MFIRVKKIGPYEYLYLVENAREGGRHVQRVIKALGRRDEVENSDLLDGLIASAARHSRRSIVLSSFYRGELPELRRLSIGPDLVFGRLWHETGCADVLRDLLGERQFGFDVERAIYLTVLHRLMVCGSDRHAHDWHQGLRIPGAEALTLKQAYKAMAWLGETAKDDRPMTDLVEEALYRHRQPLFGELSVAFFDTTSLYFEGRGGATLGRRGFSKDFRPQEPADEFVGAQRHDLCLAAVAIVLPGEVDITVLELDQTRVGDSDAMGVAAQIGQHCLRASEGRFGVDDPVNAGEIGKALGEDRGVTERGERAGEAQVAGHERRAQPRHEDVTEAPRQNAHRQQEPRAARHPPGLVRRQTTGRDDAV